MSDLSGQQFSFGRRTAPYDHRLNASVGRVARTTDPGTVTPSVGGDARIGQLQSIAGDAAGAAQSVARLEENRSQRADLIEQQEVGDFLSNVVYPHLADMQAAFTRNEVKVNDPAAWTIAIAEHLGQGESEAVQQAARRAAFRLYLPMAQNDFAKQETIARQEVLGAAQQDVLIAESGDALLEAVARAKDATGASAEDILSVRMGDAVESGDIARVREIGAILDDTAFVKSALRKAERNQIQNESLAESRQYDEVRDMAAMVDASYPDNPHAAHKMRLSLGQHLTPHNRAVWEEREKARWSNTLRDELDNDVLTAEMAGDTTGLSSIQEEAQALHDEGQLSTEHLNQILRKARSAVPRSEIVPTPAEMDAINQTIDTAYQTASGAFMHDGDFRIGNDDSLREMLSGVGVGVDERGRFVIGGFEMPGMTMQDFRDDILEHVAQGFEPMSQAEFLSSAEGATEADWRGHVQTNINAMMTLGRNHGVVFKSVKDRWAATYGNINFTDLSQWGEPEERMMIEAEHLWETNPQSFAAHAGGVRAWLESMIANRGSNSWQDTARVTQRRRTETGSRLALNEDGRKMLKREMQSGGWFGRTGRLYRFRDQQAYMEDFVLRTAYEQYQNGATPEVALDFAITAADKYHVMYTPDTSNPNTKSVFNIRSFETTDGQMLKSTYLPVYRDLAVGFLQASRPDEMIDTPDRMSIAQVDNAIVVIDSAGIPIPDFSIPINHIEAIGRYHIARQTRHSEQARMIQMFGEAVRDRRSQMLRRGQMVANETSRPALAGSGRVSGSIAGPTPEVPEVPAPVRRPAFLDEWTHPERPIGVPVDILDFVDTLGPGPHNEQVFNDLLGNEARMAIRPKQEAQTSGGRVRPFRENPTGGRL